MNDSIQDWLEKRKTAFQTIVSNAFDTLTVYAEKPAFEWLDLKNGTPRKKDAGHYRRLRYVHNRVAESLRRINENSSLFKTFNISNSTELLPTSRQSKVLGV